MRKISSKFLFEKRKKNPVTEIEERRSVFELNRAPPPLPLVERSIRLVLESHIRIHTLQPSPFLLTRDAVQAARQGGRQIELATELSRARAPRHAQLISREDRRICIGRNVELEDPILRSRRNARIEWKRDSKRTSRNISWIICNYRFELGNINMRGIFNESSAWKRFLRRWKNITDVE